MPSQPLLKGISAAPGLAQGGAFWVEMSCASHFAGSVVDTIDLQDALLQASAQLAKLMERVERDEAEILEFQLAMLEDDTLCDPVREACEAGMSSIEAWQQTLDGHVNDYEQSEDEYFQARASDLRDIRDRVLRILRGETEVEIPAGSILLATDLTPSRFLGLDWDKGGGVVLREGSPSSHLAMLARSRGVPMLVGIESLLLGAFPNETRLLLDADLGVLRVDPSNEENQAFENKLRLALEEAESLAPLLNQPAQTGDGTEVKVLINVALPEELAKLNLAQCDGIGLMRSEFLFQHGPPSEESQYRSYQKLLEWAGQKSVTIRTLDAGGDKPLPGLEQPSESNPFMGLRGLRLSLRQPEVFRIQLRALCRAAVHGNLKVMVPMVTVPDELHSTRELLEDVCAELSSEGTEYRMPLLGMMVEVPAAALAPELFADAAFFSIGSNDLVQYLTASARDLHHVADLADPGHPAVLRVIRELSEHCARSGQELSLCGDMGSDPNFIAQLLEMGLRNLSVAPARLAQTKWNIRETNLEVA
jgi:phosphotransferase system enzyme I (PtsI)